MASQRALHECEVFENGSDVMEGNSSMASCKKNPGHPSFIPYPDFCLADLPLAWREQEMFKQLIEIAEKTVKLRVGYVSKDRPDGYAFSGQRGERRTHTGSGWIQHVMARDDTPCPCTDCVRGDTTHQGVWLELKVITARHVVFNAEEAKSTRVDIHYDEKDSRRNGTMKTIWAYDVLQSKGVEDACVLICAAHDLKRIQLEFPLDITLTPTPELKISMDDPCLVISHPHGSPKKITVGELKDFDSSKAEALVAYNSSTCPGCSGAPVLVFYTDRTRLTFQMSVHTTGGVNGDLNHGSCVCVLLN